MHSWLTTPSCDYDRLINLSIRDCCSLAVIFASSPLQLYDTPWIGSGCTLDDILFPKREFVRSIAINFQRPFVRDTYHSALDGSPVVLHTQVWVPLPQTMRPDCYAADQTIENSKQEEDPKAPANLCGIAILCILRRWLTLKKKEGDLSLTSKNAIAHLITCFTDPRADLTEPDFHQQCLDTTSRRVASLARQGAQIPFPREGTVDICRWKSLQYNLWALSSKLHRLLDEKLLPGMQRDIWYVLSKIFGDSERKQLGR